MISPQMVDVYVLINEISFELRIETMVFNLGIPKDTRVITQQREWMVLQYSLMMLENCIKRR